MMTYFRFFVGNIFWQIVYNGILTICTRIISIPFVLVNKKLIAIPLAAYAYFSGLVYALFVVGAVTQYSLNPVVLCTVFSIELLMLAFINQRPENPEDEIIAVINFLAKILIIPLFILLYITRCSFGLEFLFAISKMIKWILKLPVIGTVVEWLTNFLAGKILICVAFACVIICLLGVIKFFYRKHDTNTKE